jgi:putative transcriptional regulator
VEKHVIKPQQGIILISEPSLRDFYFRQSIVLLAEHNTEGSFGIIINKPIETKLNEILKDFPEFNAPVFLGGPVKTDSIFFLHTREDVEDSLEIMKGLYWGGNIEVIREMINLGQIRENEIRFYIGYAGWDPSQLDREIKEKSWILSHTTVAEVIDPNPENLWRTHLKNMGKDYALWSNFPVDPSFN